MGNNIGNNNNSVYTPHFSGDSSVIETSKAKGVLKLVGNKIDQVTTRLGHSALNGLMKGSSIGVSLMKGAFVRKTSGTPQDVPELPPKLKKSMKMSRFNLPHEFESKESKEDIRGRLAAALSKLENAKPGDTIENIQKEIKDLNNLIKELDKYGDKTTRANLSPEGWKALDKVTQARVQESFNELGKALNASDCKINEKTAQSMVSSLLATSLAYTHIPDGAPIKMSIPVKGTDGKYKMVEYEVKQVKIGNDLPVHILKSEGQKTFVSIRGTDPYFGKTGKDGAVESLAHDVDFGGIGKNAISERQLDMIKDEIGSSDVVITGHSLGGNLAMRLADKLAKTGEKGEVSVQAFSAPGLDKKTLKDFDNGVAHNTTLWSNEKDAVSGAGDGFPKGATAVEFHFEGDAGNVNPVEIHTYNGFASAASFKVVDIESENAKGARTFSETFVRKGLGRAIDLATRSARPTKASISADNKELNNQRQIFEARHRAQYLPVELELTPSKR